MSLFSSMILPRLEKKLIELEPQIAAFLLTELKKIAHEVLEWVEKKIGMQIQDDAPTPPELVEKK